MLLGCETAAMSHGQDASVPVEYSDLTIEGWHVP